MHAGGDELHFASYDEVKGTDLRVNKDMPEAVKESALEACKKAVGSKLVVSPAQRLSTLLKDAQAMEQFAEGHPVGSELVVEDVEGSWLGATVKAIDKPQCRFKASFKGWPAKHDEWVSIFDGKHKNGQASRTNHSAGKAKPQPQKLPSSSSKAPTSGFMLFCSHKRGDVAKLHPNKPKEVMIELGKKWGTLSQEEKQQWAQRAKLESGAVGSKGDRGGGQGGGEDKGKALGGGEVEGAKGGADKATAPPKPLEDSPGDFTTVIVP